MSQPNMTGRDLYLRFNNGPVRHFRAWDTEQLIDAIVDRGMNDPDPVNNYTVQSATEAEYRAERARSK